MAVLVAAELGLAYRELVERVVGRPLRLAEQAIDVLGLDAALEQAKDDLEAAIRAAMLEATKRWIVGAQARPTLAVTQAMLEPLNRLRELGRLEAAAELDRLGYTGVRLPLPARSYAADPTPGRDRDLDGYLRRNLPAIGVRIEDELVAADFAGASEQAIANALLRVPGGRDIASRLVSTGLIDGLALTFEENADLVRCWEYTAVLDNATCRACRPLDGRRFDSLEEALAVMPGFGPNPLCQGGGRCRCRLVPCPVSEVGQATPDEPGPEPAVDGEPWVNDVARHRRAVTEGLEGYDPALTTMGELRERGLVGGPISNDPRLRIPGERLQALEREVLDAGGLLDDRLQERVTRRVGDVAARRAALEADLAEARAAYQRADDAYRQAIRRADAAEKTLTAAIRDEITARGDLEPWEVYRAVRADARLVALKARHTDELLALQAQRNPLLERVTEARKVERALDGEIALAARAELLEILDEAGIVMGRGDEFAGWAYSTGGRRGKAKEILDRAADLFPRSWIRRAQNRPLEPKFTANGRGYFRQPGTIVVSGGDRSKIPDDLDGFATAIHELGHFQEHVDGRIRLLEWAFYQRRTRTAGYGDQEAERRFPKGLGYGAHETYREDAFVESYMGKTYGNSTRASYELLTMGLEALWTRSYDLDPEMRRFILGLLATL